MNWDEMTNDEKLSYCRTLADENLIPEPYHLRWVLGELWSAEQANARLMAALEAAAEYSWQSEVIEPQMSDLLIGDDNEYADKSDWLDSKIAEWMEAQP